MTTASGVFVPSGLAIGRICENNASLRVSVAESSRGGVDNLYQEHHEQRRNVTT